MNVCNWSVKSAVYLNTIMARIDRKMTVTTSQKHNEFDHPKLYSFPETSLYICPRELELNRFLALNGCVQVANDVLDPRDRRLVSLFAFLTHQSHQCSANGFVIANAKMLFDASAELIDAAADLFDIVLR